MKYDNQQMPMANITVILYKNIDVYMLRVSNCFAFIINHDYII